MAKKTKGELLFERMLRLAPVKWEKFVDKLGDEDRAALAQYGMCLAQRAAEIAAYVDYRRACEMCGASKNHKGAVKNVNRVGRTVHCAAFGFNEYRPFSF